MVKYLIPFLSLLLLPVQLFALGFNDIDVFSSIGEPLSASIVVHDLGSEPVSNCFEAHAENSALGDDLSLNISTLDSGKALVRIKSLHAVQEPILNIVVNNVCESVGRHYTVLLDLPSTTIQIPVTNTSKTAGLASTVTQSVLPVENQTRLSKFIQHKKDAPNKEESNKDEPNVAKQNAQSDKKSKSNNIKHRNQVSVNQVKSTIATNQATKPLVDETLFKPRLSLALSTESLLRLDNRLDLGNQAAVGLSSNQQVKDIEAVKETSQQDVVALARQLAHMQQQVETLQSKISQKNTGYSNLLSESVYQVIASLFVFFGLVVGISRIDLSGLWQRFYNKMYNNKLDDADIHDDMEMLNEGNQVDEDDDIFDEPQHSSYRSKHTEGLIEFDMQEKPSALKAVLPAAVVKDDLVEFDKHYDYQDKTKAMIADKPSIIEEVGVYLEYGRNAMAIQLLYEFLLEHPKASAANWLYLLDLLAKEERVDAYEVIANECRRHFNVQLSPYSKPKDGTNKLASFERIVNHLKEISGTPEAVVFLDELIYNTRLEARLGFEQSIFEEILALRAANHEEALKDPEYQAQLAELAALQSPLTELDLPAIEPSEAFLALGRQLGHKVSPAPTNNTLLKADTPQLLL